MATWKTPFDVNGLFDELFRPSGKGEAKAPPLSGVSVTVTSEGTVSVTGPYTKLFVNGREIRLKEKP